MIVKRKLETAHNYDEITTIEEDIYNIKDNDIFGLLVSSYDFMEILPEGYNNIDEFDFNLYMDYEFGERVLFHEKFHDFTPLIFRKLSGNYAQELLSREIFVIENKQMCDDGLKLINNNFKHFNNCFNKYSNNNVVINCSNYDHNLNEEIAQCFCKIDSNFKKLYEEQTLPHRYEIKSALRKVKECGKIDFDKKSKELLNELLMFADRYNSEKNKARRRKRK